MAATQDYGKGWSEANFDKKLAELKRAKRVTGGGAQGLYYSVSFTAEAQAARRGDAEYNPAASSAGSASSENYPRQTTLNPHPIKGGEGSEGSFGCPQEPSNSPHEGSEGSSRQRSKDENQVVGDPGTDQAGEAEELLRKAEGVKPPDRQRACSIIFGSTSGARSRACRTRSRKSTMTRLVVAFLGSSKPIAAAAALILLVSLLSGLL